jgi:hypothetical protein
MTATPSPEFAAGHAGRRCRARGVNELHFPRPAEGTLQTA